MPPTLNTITRSTDDYVRQDMTQRTRMHHMPLKNQHFQKEKEYVRAINAAKLQQMFSKPFIRAMNDHIDGVYVLAPHPTSITTFASGSVDGCIKIYDISSGHVLSSLEAHQGWITGIALPSFTAARRFEELSGSAPSAGHSAPGLMVSCARDSQIRLWRLPDADVLGDTGVASSRRAVRLLNSIPTKYSPAALAHHQTTGVYAVAAAEAVFLYDHERNEPVSRLLFSEGGAQDLGYSAVQFNPAEQHLLAAISETSTVFFDTRVSKPVLRCSLWSRPNNIVFNSYYPTMFATACNDSYAYTFDFRNFQRTDGGVHALERFTGNTQAVLTCEFSPDGSILATGGYDDCLRLYNIRTVDPYSRRTIRNTIGSVNFMSLDDDVAVDAPEGSDQGHSHGHDEPPLRPPPRDYKDDVSGARVLPASKNIRPFNTYHSARMRRVWALRFSGDGRFLLSGSDDANIRVWKTRANEALRTLSPRESEAMNYRDTLINKYQNAPEVHDVLNSRRLPQRIRTSQRQIAIQAQAARRKEENARNAGKPGAPGALTKVVRDLEK